jgi:hypothetical protein
MLACCCGVTPLDCNEREGRESYQIRGGSMRRVGVVDRTLCSRLRLVQIAGEVVRMGEPCRERDAQLVGAAGLGKSRCTAPRPDRLADVAIDP